MPRYVDEYCVWLQSVSDDALTAFASELQWVCNSLSPSVVRWPVVNQFVPARRGDGSEDEEDEGEDDYDDDNEVAGEDDDESSADDDSAGSGSGSGSDTSGGNKPLHRPKIVELD